MRTAIIWTLALTIGLAVLFASQNQAAAGSIGLASLLVLRRTMPR